MAASGYTPIQLYRTATASTAPIVGNLSDGELAINYNSADMALYAKNSSGSVIRIMNNPAGLKYPTADGTNGQVIKTDGAGNLSWITPAVGTVTAVSVASANGFAGTSSGGATPALTLSTTITGLLKGNGTAISAATSGTDYAPATSGTSILYGDGAGGFSSVTIGSGVSFAGGTLSATGSGGTITGSGTTNYVPKFSSSTALSNSVIYDNGTNVGIGTTSPSAKLHVTGKIWGNASINPANWDIVAGNQGFASTSPSNNMEVGGYCDISFGWLGVWSNHPLNIGANGSNHISVTTTGNVGIGTTSPSYKLQLSTDSAAKPSTNTWTIASDARIKKVTGEYTKGLDAVCALRPITYEYNGAAGFEVDGKENISIIAQEAIEHFPECVGTFNAKLNATDEIETELYNWNGHALTFALVNAVKELKAELDAVKTELTALKGL